MIRPRPRYLVQFASQLRLVQYQQRILYGHVGLHVLSVFVGRLASEPSEFNEGVDKLDGEAEEIWVCFFINNSKSSSEPKEIQPNRGV